MEAPPSAPTSPLPARARGVYCGGMNAAMEITLNGQARSIEAPATVEALLARLEIRGRRVAVMINDAIVPKATFGEASIRPGDRVEIIQMVGGG